VPTTAEDLGLLFSLASHGLATRMAAAFDGEGMTPRAHCVLSKAMGEELTQGRLAELSGLDKTTMVATIDELERSGLAERRPAPNDRRARVIAVTPKGEEVVARGREIADRVQQEILGELPGEEREVFVNALSRLVNCGLGTPAECEQRVRRPATVPK
jgi:MarR family transcriptional regulator, transcriptional regulator for hemolysin